MDEIKEIQTFGTFDTWIIAKSKIVFDSIDADFKSYDYSKGINKLDNFLVADLSNIYLDVCKDKLYCDSKNGLQRRASQSAMAMIAKSLISTLAPILTYTMDELLTYAPSFIKDDAKDIFDFKKYHLPFVQSTLNTDVLFQAKEKFNESVEILKKDKIIKSTLELVIFTDCSDILELTSTEAEDLFIVSKLIKHSEENSLATFKVNDFTFEVYNASKSKCPRCWKYRAQDEQSLCHRCHSVVN